MLEARDVTKTFGSLQVLKRLSLSCGPGEIALLVGANGAGKSTLLRVLAGLARPDSGEVVRQARSIGFLSHHLFLYSRLSVKENLDLFASVRDLSGSEALIDRLELSKCTDRPVGELSKGLQARVGIARAFIGQPDVVILDEPTSNLDERGTGLLVAEIRRRQEETGGKASFLIATHDLHRMSSLATRVVVLSDGAVVGDSGASASPSAIAHVLERYREVNR